MPLLPTHTEVRRSTIVCLFAPVSVDLPLIDRLRAPSLCVRAPEFSAIQLPLFFSSS